MQKNKLGKQHQLLQVILTLEALPMCSSSLFLSITSTTKMLMHILIMTSGACSVSVASYPGGYIHTEAGQSRPVYSDHFLKPQVH